MYIINNRYRILENLEHQPIYSSYLAQDLVKKNNRLQINITNSEYAPEGLILYYIENFTTLRGIDNINIIKNYDFDSVFFIDNKESYERQYIFSNEYFEDNIELYELVSKLPVEKMIEFFINICQTVNFLHLKGFLYGGINTLNILIDGNSDAFTFKLRDIASVELQKYNYWSYQEEDLCFKAPEVLNGGLASTISDIYSLGILLLTFINKAKCYSSNISEEICKTKKELLTKSIPEERLYNSLISVVEVMTSTDASSRYKDINTAIKEINMLLNTSYSPFIVEDLERLNSKTNMVGRDSEYDKIIKDYDNLKDYNGSGKNYLIHGESGVGKTRFLKRIRHAFSIMRVNLYCSFPLINASPENISSLTDVLRALIARCNPSITEKYETELIKFVPELGEKKFIIPSTSLTGINEDYRLINRMYNFTIDCIGSNPTVFIIDNLHISDDFSLDFFDYLIHKNIRNLMFVLSYSDSDYYTNKKFSDFIEKMKSDKNSLDMPLRELKIQEVTQVVKNLLGMPDDPKNLASVIYTKTYGNLVFIEELVKNLYSKKILYINKCTGEWTTDYMNFDEIPMPETLEQAVSNQVRDLDNETYKIVESFSVFSSAVPMEIISKFSGIFFDESTCKFSNLVSTGVLTEKINDRGFVYDFSNKSLKTHIYNNIKEENKRSYHELAASIIESSYADGKDYVDELIYHLEKAGEKDRIIDYYLANAEKMDFLRNRHDAARNLEKAALVFDPNSIDPRRIDILYRIGLIYSKSGNYADAVIYYLKSAEIAKQSSNLKSQLDALNETSIAYAHNSDYKNALYYVKQVEDIFSALGIKKSDEFLYESLECKRIKATLLVLSKNYSEATSICLSALDLCNDSTNIIKGYLLILLGEISRVNSDIEKSLEYFIRSKKIFEMQDFYTGIALSYNYIGDIYRDYYQQFSPAIEYFEKAKVMSASENLPVLEVSSLIHLGRTYSYLYDYKLSYTILNEALDKIKIFNDKNLIFLCYICLSNICFKLNYFKEGFYYYNLVLAELSLDFSLGDNFDLFYNLTSEINFLVGDFDKALSELTSAITSNKDERSLQVLQGKIISENTNIINTIDTLNYSEHKKNISSLLNLIKSPENKLNFIFDIAIILCNCNKHEYALNILDFSSKITTENLSSYTEVKRLYLVGLLGNELESEKLFISALAHARKSNRLDLLWRINNALGDLYISKKSYYLGVSYYFESCEILKTIALDLPEGYRISFLRGNYRLKPFNSLLELNGKNKAVIISQEDVKNLLVYKDTLKILNSKKFLASSKKTFKTFLPEGIDSFQDIIKNLYSDPEENLNIISKYIMGLALATRVYIIMDRPDSDFYVVASSSTVKIEPENMHIVERSRIEKRPILIMHPLNKLELGSNIIPLDNLKSLICIPIFSNDMPDISSTPSDRNIIAYIYMESEKALNNFNNNIIEQCMEMNNIINFIIEKYLLNQTAYVDKLTNTLTRKALDDKIIECTDKYKNEGTFSLIMFDLDMFKSINDKFGHQTGDIVLKKICELVLDSLDKKSFCGRFGGEEFIIILSDVSFYNAYVFSEDLRKKIENAHILGDRFPVTVSLGISNFPTNGQWKQELVEKADQALYIAKESGRNRSQCWSSEFTNKFKVTNRLTGIISGNPVEDYRKVSVMIELINLIKSIDSSEEKIYKLLGRIIEATEAQNGILFIINDEEINKVYGRTKYQEEWLNNPVYNEELLKSVIETTQGKYLIDWEEMLDYDPVTQIPDWYSIMIIPIEDTGVLTGVLYLKVPISHKEFSFDDFNFISTLAGVTACLIK